MLGRIRRTNTHDMLSRSAHQRLSTLLQRLRASPPGVLALRVVEIDLLTHAASLSFFMLLSMAPLLVLVLWVVASLYPQAQAEVMHQIAELAGESAATVARTVVDNANAEPDIGSLAGVWGTLLLFFGATTVFARLQATLNLIFGYTQDGLGPLAWVRKRLFSFGVVLALGFLVVASTVLSTVIDVLFSSLPVLLPLAGNVAALLVYALAFAALFHYLPDRRVAWRQALLGGLATAVLFMAGRWAIGVYISRAAPGSAYGSMGTLVVMLVWMYYAAMVFFCGALVTDFIDRRAHPEARDPVPG